MVIINIVHTRATLYSTWHKAQSSPVRLATHTYTARPNQTEQTKDRSAPTTAHLAAGYRKEIRKKTIAEKTSTISTTMNKKTRDAMRCNEEEKRNIMTLYVRVVRRRRYCVVGRDSSYNKKSRKKKGHRNAQPTQSSRPKNQD